MTSIRIVSDVHLEFHSDFGKKFIQHLCDAQGAEMLIIAGDFAPLGTKSIPVELYFRELCDAYKHVFYVTGNHEFYHTSYPIVDKVLCEISGLLHNFHWLNNSSVDIDGIRFGGTTLWFKETPDTDVLAYRLNDFSLIKGFSSWVYLENKRATDFIKKNAKSLDVMVTHHLPAQASVAKRFKNDRMNCFFTCDVMEHIRDSKIKLWVHGHTHDSCAYRVNDTYVVCNPYGYQGHEVNHSFDLNTIVELDMASRYKVLKFVEDTSTSYAVFNEVDVRLEKVNDIIPQGFAQPIISGLSLEEARYFKSQLDEGKLV